MLGSVSLVALSARVRSLLVLLVALLAMLGAVAVLAARADAVEVQPTNLPLPGSNFQGGDGNQANPTAAADATNPAPYPANIDWQHLAGLPGLVHATDPNALDSTFDTGSHENDPLNWDLDLDPDCVTPAKSNFFASWNYVDETPTAPSSIWPSPAQESARQRFPRLRAQPGRAVVDERLRRRLIQCRTDGDLIISYEIQNSTTSRSSSRTGSRRPRSSAAEAAGGFTNGEGCSKTGTFIDYRRPRTRSRAAINTGTTITNYLPSTPAPPTSAPGSSARARSNLTDLRTDRQPLLLVRPDHALPGDRPIRPRSIHDLAPRCAAGRNCTICGTKCHDIDADGVIDAGEPAIAGWKLYIDANNNDLFDAGEPTATTDAEGDYTFTTSRATYTIREAPDAEQAAGLNGYFCSFPSKTDSLCEHSVTISAADRTITGKDFANYKKAVVKVEKQTVPDGAAGSFSFTSTITGKPSFSLSDGGIETTTVDPGVYTATETLHPDFNLTDITCSGDTITPNSSDTGNTATFNAQSGETITCVFTNTRKTGKLEVVKKLEPTTDTGKFDLKIDGVTKAAAVGHDGTTGEQTVNTGNHTVAEAGANGTDLNDYVTSLECKDGATIVPSTGGTVAVTETSDIVCTFTNKRKAKVTIIKDADPNGAQDFSFTTTLGAPFSLDDDGDNTLSNQQVFSGIAGFGAASVTEGVLAGWTLTDITCNAAANLSRAGQVANITVDPGDDITCTFVNKKDAKVTIVKEADPADGTDFEVTTTLGDGSNFKLDDGGDATLSDSKTFTYSGTGYGSKTVTELAQAGWTNTSLTCSEGQINASTATLSVDPGDDITCTYVNTKHASLQVVKVTDPASDPQDFDFDLTGSGVDADLDLDTDPASAGVPSSMTYNLDASQLGAKTVTESGTPGWSLTNLVCSGGGADSSTDLGTRKATLDIDAGETVLCTFTNTKHASLQVVKVTDPASDPQDFDFDLTGVATPAGVTLDTDAGSAGTPSQVTYQVTAAQLGAYTVTEDATAGWSLTGLVCSGGGADSSTDLGTRKATLDIDAGETVVCTFTNTKGSSLTVVKVTGPASDPQDFDFDLTGTGVDADLDLDTDPGSAGTLSSRTFPLDASQLGAKTVTESVTAGWSLTNLVCMGGGADSSTDLGTRKATLDIDAGESVICTFTNTKDATVQVVKVTDPASDPQDFDFDLTGAGFDADLDLDTDPGSAGTPSQMSYTLTAAQLGAHTITESTTPGWTLTNLVCTGGGSDSSTDTATRKATLDIDAGETVLCTFTNTKDASLQVVKVTDPASDPQDFDFDLTGAGVDADLDLDTDGGDGTLPSQATFTLNASQLGAHTVTESGTPGWSLTNLVCSGGGADSSTDLGTRKATLDIDAGETVLCTFTNTKHASLQVVKVTDPASDPQDFDFDLTGAATPAGVTLDTDAGSAGTPSQVTYQVTAAQLGAYTVTEDATAGWSLTGLVCSGGGSDSSTDTATRKATLDIDAGETVLCTYVNTKHASLQVVKVTDPASDPQDFDFDLTGSGVDADLDLDTDPASAGVPSSMTYNLDASQLGAKTVTESGTPGWSLTNLVCSGGGADSSTDLGTRKATLDIDAGETVLCTFTNTKHASLQVVKVTDPASDPQDFDFDLTGAATPAGVTLDTDAGSAGTPSQVTYQVTAAQLGAYTVTEDATAGWSLTGLVCSGGGADSSTDLGTRKATLDIDAGETVVCTFTNTKGSSLTVVKVTGPASDPQDFDFDLTGTGVDADLDLDTDPGSAGTLSSRTFPLDASQLGAKTVTESVTAGWSLTNLVCMGGGADSSTDLGTRKATLDIDAGESVICTFTNTKDATVTVIKDAVPDDAQDFAFTTEGLGAGFSLDDDGDPALSDEKVITVSGDDFGAKSVTESAQAGWDLTDLDCTGDLGWERDGATADLDVDPGEEITCTFENTKRGSVTVTKTEAGVTPAGEWTFRLTGGPDDVELTQTATPQDATLDFGNLKPGTYTLCEVDMPIDWFSSLEDDPYNGDRTEDVEAGTATVCIEFEIEPGEAVSFAVDNTRPETLVLKEGNLLVHDGDTITYTFDVSNKGNTPLENVSVVDPKCDTGTITPGDSANDSNSDGRRAARAGRLARRDEVRDLALRLHVRGAGVTAKARRIPRPQRGRGPSPSISRATRSPTPMTTRRRSSTRGSTSTRSCAARATASGPTTRPATTRSRSTSATRSSTGSPSPTTATRRSRSRSSSDPMCDQARRRSLGDANGNDKLDVSETWVYRLTTWSRRRTAIRSSTRRGDGHRRARRPEGHRDGLRLRVGGRPASGHRDPQAGPAAALRHVRQDGRRPRRRDRRVPARRDRRRQRHADRGRDGQRRGLRRRHAERPGEERR